VIAFWEIAIGWVVEIACGRSPGAGFVQILSLIGQSFTLGQAIQMCDPLECKLSSELAALTLTG